MGLFLRLNLFYQVSHQDVYHSYASFYAKRGHAFTKKGREYRQLNLFKQDNNWTVLYLDGGWEWTVRREAQLYVSHELNCPGFLVFVYDGNYWGYEFFRKGEILDHFVQEEEPADGSLWFPGSSCIGNPQVIADVLSYLSVDDIASYLVRDPLATPYLENLDEQMEEEENERRWQLHRDLDVPARQGDEFHRFDECAVLDFLRLLGVRVELQPCPDYPHIRCVTLLPPRYRTFWISSQTTHRESIPELEAKLGWRSWLHRWLGKS
jgi:hypothetical protein